METGNLHSRIVVVTNNDHGQCANQIQVSRVVLLATILFWVSISLVLASGGPISSVVTRTSIYKQGVIDTGGNII